MVEFDDHDDAFPVPPKAADAVREMRALLELSWELRSDCQAAPRLIGIAWDRADEAVRGLCRLFESPPGQPFAVPRIPIALTARWLAEGWALLAWIAVDTEKRIKMHVASGAAQRRDLAQRWGFDPQLAGLRGLDELSGCEVPAPSSSKLVATLGPDAGPIYAALCEISHWNAAWLADSSRDGPSGYWVAHLATVPAFYREMILAAAQMHQLDAAPRLNAIPRSTS